MYRNHNLHGAVIVFAAAILCLSGATTAESFTYRLIYTFCAQPSCPDGANPAGGLVSDAAGNLFGFASNGGDAGSGTIFELVPKPRGSGYRYKRLYSFCAKTDCADGAFPSGTPGLDGDGNIYGVTAEGGSATDGITFELVRAGVTRPKLRVLYSFCSINNCADGAAPQTGLAYRGQASGAPYDGASALYGTTAQGGAGSLSPGIIYALKRDKNGRWKERVLYSFCSVENCDDGISPYAALTVDSAGNLLGTTTQGGLANAGTVFKLSRQNGTWSELVLHHFCIPSPGCSDGSSPASPLTLDAAGNIYGTAQFGGSDDEGTLFKIQTGDLPYEVLHNFCTAPNCTDGWGPVAQPVFDSAGNLFGAAAASQNVKSGGTLYEVSGNSFNVVHSFCIDTGSSGCIDGSVPFAAPFIDSSGHLFGTTSSGGANNSGVAYEFTP